VTQGKHLPFQYEVFHVVDAVAGTSEEAHRAGLERIAQAGGQPITWIQLACELRRDWAREKTTPGFSEIVFASIHP
jgi:isochorismate hydrolase